MEKMLKKLGIVLCAVVMLVMTTTVKAMTWDTKGETLGSVEKTSDTITTLKGASEKDENNTYPGPITYDSDAKLSDGITEEVNIVIDLDNFKEGEYFHVSNSIDYKDSYSTEARVDTKKEADKILVYLDWNSSLNAEITENGTYTYQWHWFVKDSKIMLVVSILKDGEVIDASDEIDLTSGAYDSTSGDYLSLEVTDETITDMTAGYIWFYAIDVEAGVQVYNKPELVVAPEVTGEDVTVEEEVTDVLTESLAAEATEDEELKELLDNHDVTVGLETKKLDEKDLKPEDVSKFEEALEGAIVTDYFDLSIVVRADGVDEYHLKNLNKEITLTVSLPELPAVKEGYKRTFYILREHDGVVEKLDATLTEDGNSLTFASDKFSTYVLAYLDEVDNTENPKTGDNIVAFMGLASISLLGLGVAVRSLRKENN